MQQHQFDSFESAIKYLEERGTLTYHGWHGQINGYYVYSYIDRKGFKWHMDIYKTGLIEFREFI